VPLNLNNGANFKVSHKRTSSQSGMCQRNNMAKLPERRCATNSFSAPRATTMGQHFSGQVPIRIWEVSFFLVPGWHGGHNQASHARSLSTSRCSKLRHLTNGLFGRRVYRGVFPATAVAGAAQPRRWMT
jgi:hypothetical protein